MSAPEYLVALANVDSSDLDAAWVARRLPGFVPAAAQAPQSPAVDLERLLDAEEVAAYLGGGTSKHYVETLIRQRRIPSVTLPGTERDGRVRAGKQKRVRLGALQQVVREWEDAGVRPASPRKKGGA